MDEPQRPPELSEDAWQATPHEVRVFIAMLRERLALLEARVNQTSQNSSKPPSSDPPSAPPPPVKTPRGKPKAKGAQRGHPDQQRDLLAVEEVTHVVPLRPTNCPHCQHDVPADVPAHPAPRRQQVWEIPPGVPVVTEYQYHTVTCPACQVAVTAERPADVPPGAFGPRVIALIAMLHGRYRLSTRELVSLLQMLWGVPISVGGIARAQHVASQALAPADAEVQQAVTRAAHANVDETRWREATRKPWLWVVVTAMATLFRIQDGRGKAQLQTLLGADYPGLVTSDRLRTYNSLDPQRRQVCWAHLVRNLRGRADARGAWQPEAQALLNLAEEVLVLWAQGRDGTLDRATMECMIRAIQQAMWERVDAYHTTANYLGGLCADLVPRWDALWTFLRVDGVEPTNNAAERALRPAVLWRKGCYGTQSADGSRFVERILTVSATCRQHDRPLLPYLVDAITAYWSKRPAPKLLPFATP
jgi:transposase